MDNKVNLIYSEIHRDFRQQIFNKNLLVKNVFEFFMKRNAEPEIKLILCTNGGLILQSFGLDFKHDVTGYTVDIASIKDKIDFKGIAFFDEYTVLYLGDEDEHVFEILSSSEELLNIVSDNQRQYTKLLNSLNCINNSLMMCDNHANVTFANTIFCENFHVNDRDALIGRNIFEIMKENGIEINSIETNASQLKMVEVLETGKAQLDCGVRMESKYDDKYLKLVSNDIFPVFDEDEDGKISGLIEISRSYQQEIKKTRSFMGLNAEYVFDDVIGKSNLILNKIKLAKEFACNRGTVLITGESGVGKEIFAQAIHSHSLRNKGPFVALNCANFPTELIESELFGYVEGAFTGASKKGQIGKFELANGGTLFLDEIGELPYYFQSKLLRVLETWAVTRVGGLKEVPVDVRLIAATNRNLPEMIESGLFRQDLYYRLQVLTLDIPPLKERIEDVPLIAQHFLNSSAKQNGHTPKSLSDSAKRSLMYHEWPGNARELKNVVSRIDLLYKENIITSEAINSALFSEEYIPEKITETPQTEIIDKRKKEIDIAYMNLLNDALDITKGNKKNAADLLGISRKTIYRMLEKYDMD